MLNAGGLVRCTVVKLCQPRRPVGGVCSAVTRKSPVPVGFSGCGHYSLVRAASGISSGDAAPGLFEKLADSAPVHLCEQFLVSTQQVTGLPWWLSIAVATFSVRTLVTLPSEVYNQVNSSKLEALKPEISDLAKRLNYEVAVHAKQKGWTDKKCRVVFRRNLKRIVSQLHIRDNCHPYKFSVLAWIQLPLWVSLSVALRNLSLYQSEVHADLAAGGALWFSDLTSPDPFFLLPVCLGLMNLLMVEVSSLQTRIPSKFQPLILNVFRGFCVLTIPIAAMIPSSVVLYWFTSSLVGFSHRLLLQSSKVRRILRLPTQRSESPYKDLWAGFVSKYCKK